MPNIATGLIPAYVTDLGTSVPNLRFKIRADQLANSGFAAAPDVACNAGGGLFTPRAIRVDFVDGSSIRFPVSLPTGVVARIQALAALPGFACAHLEGERWSFIPPNFVGVASPIDPVYTLPDGPTDINVGTAAYTSDLLGGIRVRWKAETNPQPIYLTVLSCLANFTEGIAPCTTAAGLQPRKLTVLARNTNGGQIARLTKPQNFGQDVIDCAANLLSVGNCVRYEGESARNAHLLVPAP